MAAPNEGWVVGGRESSAAAGTGLRLRLFVMKPVDGLTNADSLLRLLAVGSGWVGTAAELATESVAELAAELVAELAAELVVELAAESTAESAAESAVGSVLGLVLWLSRTATAMVGEVARGTGGATGSTGGDREWIEGSVIGLGGGRAGDVEGG